MAINKTSEAGLELIRSFERFESKAYRCPAGVWTIGYGHTSGVKEGDTITKEKAEENLKIFVSRIDEFMRKSIKVPLAQNQWDALASFIYNVGQGAFNNSQIHQMINHGALEQVPHLFMRWRWHKDPKTGEKVESEGLVNRRRREGAMWLNAKMGDPLGPLPTKKYYKTNRGLSEI